MQQRIHQSSRVHSGAGVDHHSGRLVNRHDVRILIQHLERDVLGRRVQWRRVCRLDIHAVAGANLTRRPAGLAVYPNVAIPDPLLDAGPAVLRKPLVRQMVQALAGIFGSAVNCTVGVTAGSGERGSVPLVQRVGIEGQSDACGRHQPAARQFSAAHPDVRFQILPVKENFDRGKHGRRRARARR